MSKKKNSENQKEIEKHSNSLSLLFYEGQIAWQMNLLFIGLNVGIGTIIGCSLTNISNCRILLLVFSIFGILINVAWLGTFRRNNKYYHFRMAQARNAEPTNWKLLRKKGYRFSKGDEIIIRDKGLESNETKHKLTPFERRASNKLAIELAIWLFILGFLILFLLSGYHIIYKECILIN